MQSGKQLCVTFQQITLKRWNILRKQLFLKDIPKGNAKMWEQAVSHGSQLGNYCCHGAHPSSSHNLQNARTTQHSERTPLSNTALMFCKSLDSM
eukprot:5046442-Amphidinium_carterae.1